MAKTDPLSCAETASLIHAAIKEDAGAHGDLTTRFFLPKNAKIRGRIVSRDNGVICGAEIARRVFLLLDPSCRVRILVPDGGRVRAGNAVMEVSGGRSILTAERIALNFLGHLSGVATLTAGFTALARGTRARIYDTRKTLPGWRRLEKYAVLCGGGANHRMDLSEAVMLKDNHWTSLAVMRRAVAALRRNHARVPIEIEAGNMPQVRKALKLGADVILLDNMSLKTLKRAIHLIRTLSNKVQIEISGGVSLSSAHSLAELGPDRISVGRITHSAPALNLSLELGKARR